MELLLILRAADSVPILAGWDSLSHPNLPPPATTNWGGMLISKAGIPPAAHSNQWYKINTQQSTNNIQDAPIQPVDINAIVDMSANVFLRFAYPTAK